MIAEYDSLYNLQAINSSDITLYSVIYSDISETIPSAANKPDEAMQESTIVRAGILLVLVLVGVESASIRSNRLRRAIPSKPLLVGYWGQNGAGPRFGPSNYERSLKWFCENSKYDIINLAFLVTFFDSRNQDSLPGLNFAYHCFGGVTSQHPSLLRCPKIEEGIKSCQQNKKKVLLSLGGATGQAILGSSENAVKLAENLWQLFLGGNDTNMRNLRPFGTAVLDGIDLNLEKGSHQYFPDHIRELRRLMATDSSKSYLITSAPQCPHPDRLLGPQTPGTALEATGELTDYVFIQFYNNPCWTGSGQFHGSLDKWLTFSKAKKVGVMIGLPAHPGASGQTQYHRNVSELVVLYKKIRSKAGVSGVMLWDCSWDQNNLVNGRMYSEHVRQILDDTPTQTPITTQTPSPNTTTTQTPSPDTTTTQTPSPNTTTQTPSPDTTTTQTPSPDTTTQTPNPRTTNGPTTSAAFCINRSSGIYKDPLDCTRFIMCSGGVQTFQSCPTGLKFNPQLLVCDWPHNVSC